MTCAAMFFMCFMTQAADRIHACRWEATANKAPSAEATNPFKLVCAKGALLKGHHGTICSLAYSPDGKTLAAGDSSGAVKLWSIGADEEPVSVAVDNSGNVRSLAFSPDGKTLVAGSIWKGKPLASICDVAKTKEVDQLQGPDHWVHHVAISPDGKWLAAAGGQGYTGAVADKYSVVIWNLDPRTAGAELDGHPGRGGIGGLAFAPDSKTLAVSCGDGSVKLWDLATRKESATVAKAGSGGLVFAPDGKTLFTGTENEITLTDVSKGEIRARWKFAATDARVLAFSKDGALLAIAGYKHLAAGYVPVIQIWDAARGKELADLGDFRFKWLALSPDGTSLAAGGNDMTIQVWKLERKPVDASDKPD
jgi:WD40 repeat protein